nr:oxidation resistance protein 1 [Polyrhizophydium stewartii]
MERLLSALQALEDHGELDAADEQARLRALQAALRDAGGDASAWADAADVAVQAARRATVAAGVAADVLDAVSALVSDSRTVVDDAVLSRLAAAGTAGAASQRGRVRRAALGLLVPVLAAGAGGKVHAAAAVKAVKQAASRDDAAPAERAAAVRCLCVAAQAVAADTAEVIRAAAMIAASEPQAAAEGVAIVNESRTLAESVASELKTAMAASPDGRAAELARGLVLLAPALADAHADARIPQDATWTVLASAVSPRENGPAVTSAQDALDAWDNDALLGKCWDALEARGGASGPAALHVLVVMRWIVSASPRVDSAAARRVLVACSAVLALHAPIETGSDEREAASELLSLVMQRTGAASIESFVAAHARAVLSSTVRPMFDHPAVDDQGRRAVPSLRDRREAALKHTNPADRFFDRDQGWKAGPAVAVLDFCASHLDRDALHEVLHLLTPPMLTLLDDFEVPYRLCGVKLVHKCLVGTADPANVRHTGLGPVFIEALAASTTYISDAELLGAALKAVRALLPVLYDADTPELINVLDTHIRERVVARFMFVLSGHARALQIMLREFVELIAMCPVLVFKFLKATLRTACDVLEVYQTDRDVQIAAADAIIAMIRFGWPRIPAYRGLIIKTAAESWRLSRELVLPSRMRNPAADRELDARLHRIIELADLAVVSMIDKDLFGPLVPESLRGAVDAAPKAAGGDVSDSSSEGDHGSLRVGVPKAEMHQQPHNMLPPVRPLLSFLLSAATSVASGIVGADLSDNEDEAEARTAAKAAAASASETAPAAADGRRWSGPTFQPSAPMAVPAAEPVAIPPVARSAPLSVSATSSSAAGATAAAAPGTEGDAVVTGPDDATELSIGAASPADIKIRGRSDAGEAVAVLVFEIIEQASSLDLLYSIEQHGISLNTLYRRCAEAGPVLIAIRDANSNVFGAFASESLGVKQGFFGNGGCFLWKQSPESGAVTVFPATGVNDYLVLNETHCIAFGGGQGRFGLWIDDELFNGHSEPCETFANEPLSSTADFHIVALEVWGFVI